MVDRDIKLLTEIGLKLKFTANTHCHADHVTGTGEMKRKMGGNLKSLISGSSGAKADVHVAHGDKVRFGEKELEVRATPGHTDGKFVWYLKTVKKPVGGLKTVKKTGNFEEILLCFDNLLSFFAFL